MTASFGRCSRWFRRSTGLCVFAVMVAAVIGALTSASESTSFAAEKEAGKPTAKPLEVLFLGDNGHHQPALRFRDLQPPMAERGIELTYTDDVRSLNRETLAAYDALMIYANIGEIAPEQEAALLEYVAGGKGFLPIHCASYCFLNSPKYIELVGAQFERHTTGVFRTEIVAPDHPLMRGFGGFESWDETYVHHRHNSDRTVLEERADGDRREPWTWVRTHGDGRVFYTAWGHDARTWGNPGFHQLIERGVRWAVKQDPASLAAYTDRPPMTPIAKDAAKFDYVEARVPFYPPGKNWGTIGEPITQMQLPLTPEQSMTHYSVPVGFKLELVAAEPELQGKPIAMNWDERGRLWVCETVDYPNELQPEGEGRDRIRICEDTDGDGRADKFTVFADRLSIPTSIAFAYGGAVVHQAPHTLFLKDTDGDDVADVRRILFTGWSTGDTHAGPSNLRYGLDNWFYSMVGYSGFEGEVGGVRHSFRTGFFRFRFDDPTASESPRVELEFLRNTNNNSWGVGFSEEGELFGSTANGNPSEHLPIPNRYYERVRGWSSSVLGGIAIDPEFDPITEKVRQVDHHGRFTAGAGHSLYTARRYPREYWNRTALVNGPTGHLTAVFQIQPNGASFISRNAWNLAASDDEWAAPIVAEVGPDGNVWIIDWYNYIVQHNPTPAGYKTGKGNAYESNLRDKRHGRIYRLAYGAAETEKSDTEKTHAEKAHTLAGADNGRLVAALSADNMFWRLHAQRLLVERRASEVAPALEKLSADPSVDEIGLNVGAIHALGTLAGLGLLDGRDADASVANIAALRHPSAGVRRVAAQRLARRAESVAPLIASGVVSDDDAHVRLAALLALAEMPGSPEAARAVLAALADPYNTQDRWLNDAIVSAAAASDVHVLKLLAAGPPASREEGTAAAKNAGGLGKDAEDNGKGANSAKPLEPTGPALALAERIAQHWARGEPTEQIGEILGPLAKSHPRMSSAIVAGLNAGWPKQSKTAIAADVEASLVPLLKSLPPASRSQLVSLAGRWGAKSLDRFAAEIAESLAVTVADEKQPEAGRIDAARQLVAFLPRDPNAVKQLLKNISPRTSPELAAGLVEAVGLSQSPESGKALVEQMAVMTPAARLAAIRVLLSRAEWSASLIDAIEKNEVRLSELSLDEKQRLASSPDKALAERAKRLMAGGGGLPNPDRQKVLDELTPLTERTGDAVAGKEVFKKQCAKCHTHQGEGAKIGPDLTGMAVHPKKELLTHIIDPSRSVEGNFRVYTVITEDGRIFTGLLASESKTSLELFDAEGKQHLVQRDEVDELIASPKSLMPDGFEKQVTQDEIANLLEFLTQRGRFVPISLDKVATIVSTRGMFYSEDADAERLIFADWTPKTFAGVPFLLVDPQEGRRANVVMLHGPTGKFPPTMPKRVVLPCNSPAAAIHLLSGVSGWGHPLGEKGSVTMTVRLHYADGETEDHALKNGEHFADYIRRVDVPQSQFAFALRGQQIRYLAVNPQRRETIREIEMLKGPDATAPVVMAVTIETASKE